MQYWNQECHANLQYALLKDGGDWGYGYSMLMIL